MLASTAAMNSDSVEFCEIESRKQDRQTTGVREKHRHIPEIKRLCLLSPAQSESTYPIGLVESTSGTIAKICRWRCVALRDIVKLNA